MIGFCAWIKGYCRFSACKLGFSEVCICIHHAQNCTESTNTTSVYLSSELVNNKGADQPAHPHLKVSYLDSL